MSDFSQMIIPPKIATVVSLIPLSSKRVSKINKIGAFSIKFPFPPSPIPTLSLNRAETTNPAKKNL